MMDIFMLREAVASVSLSHPEGCDCMVCRAVLGDEQAMAEAMDMVLMNNRRRYVTGKGEVLSGVHDPQLCEGRGCTIHHPSDHHMRAWPTRWNSNRRLLERVCEHDQGHPDPDDVAYQRSVGREGAGVHECDGCCQLR